MEDLDFEKIKNFMDESEYIDTSLDAEDEANYNQEMEDIRTITAEIKLSDILVPFNVDLDLITPEDFFEVEQIAFDDESSAEIDFVRAIYELTHVIYGARYNQSIVISSAITSIAALEEFSDTEIKKWFKIAEKLSGLKILTGFDPIDNARIQELRDLEEKRQDQYIFKNYIKDGLVDSIRKTNGDFDNLDDLIFLLISLVERNVAEERFYSSNSVEVLNSFDATALKKNIQRLNMGYMKDDEINDLLDQISFYFEDYQWEVVEYPIFLPPEKSNYMWN